ncbi:MAG: AAA family ATPase [Gemmatimonas sp.]
MGGDGGSVDAGARADGATHARCDRAQRTLRVHILGPSGSGTTTLAREVARIRGVPSFDTDDFYWLPSDPPFQAKRTIPERLCLLRDALENAPAWTLSGSLAGWGDPLVPLFDLVVFLELDPDIRMERLRRREVERYGPARIGPGGDLEQGHAAFMEWAARYEHGGLEMRSRRTHDEWLGRLPTACRLIRLDSSLPVQALVARIAIHLVTD